MSIGPLLTHWSARFAFLLYAAALAAWLVDRPRAARAAWTCGLLLYLLHAAAAFHFYHHWSHAAAYHETARQTAAMFGVDSGGGLYCNYAFTLVWTLDAIWLWRNPATYRKRRRPIALAIHSFMAFLFFNAAVVFVSGWARALGLGVTAALVVLWLRVRR